MKRIRAFLVFLCISISLLFAKERPTIALVLSGGGSRGIPEIPILAEFDKRGIYPDYILGTSMGNLIGGLYAIGYTPQEIEDLLRDGDIQGRVLNFYGRSQKDIGRAFSTSKSNLFSLDFNFSSRDISSANSLLDDQYINAYIRTAIAKVMDVRDFDEFSTPFRAIGANLHNGKKIVFEDGPLYDAMRGSMSLPVIFPPLVTEDGTYVVDGGTVDNLPIDEARALGADIVIGVDVNEDVSNFGGEAQNLESLSGATIQYSVIITQYVVKKNMTKADYMFIPKTRDLSIMDFTHLDDYLKVGQECVDENEAIFDQLQSLLEPYMPLRERVLYKDLPYLTIEKVEYPEELERYEDFLRAFEGREANEETITEFEELLDLIRTRSHLKGINYRVANGVYTLEIIPFAALGNSFSVGLQGDMGLSFNAFGSSCFHGYFNSTLALNSHFDLKSLGFDLSLEYGQGLFLSSILSVPFLKNDFYMSAKLGYGYFPPFGYRKSLNQFKNSNFLVEAETGFRFESVFGGRFDLYADIGYAALGPDFKFGGESENLWEENQVLYSLAHLDYSFKAHTIETMEYGYLDQSLALSLGYSSLDGFVYGFRYEGLLFIPLLPKFNGIYLGGVVATMHLPCYLTTSYVPNHFNSLVEQKLGLELGYKQYLKKGGKLFYKLAMAAEVTSPNYDGQMLPNAMERTLIPFAALSRFDIAALGGFGLAINDTNVTFLAKLGLHGDMAIYVEMK